MSEVVHEMLRDVSASEILAEKERIAAEKHMLEEARWDSYPSLTHFEFCCTH